MVVGREALVVVVEGQATCHIVPWLWWYVVVVFVVFVVPSLSADTPMGYVCMVNSTAVVVVIVVVCGDENDGGGESIRSHS